MVGFAVTWRTRSSGSSGGLVDVLNGFQIVDCGSQVVVIHGLVHVQDSGSNICGVLIEDVSVVILVVRVRYGSNDGLVCTSIGLNHGNICLRIRFKRGT